MLISADIILLVDNCKNVRAEMCRETSRLPPIGHAIVLHRRGSLPHFPFHSHMMRACRTSRVFFVAIPVLCPIIKDGGLVWTARPIVCSPDMWHAVVDVSRVVPYIYVMLRCGSHRDRLSKYNCLNWSLNLDGCLSASEDKSENSKTNTIFNQKSTF